MDTNQELPSLSPFELRVLREIAGECNPSMKWGEEMGKILGVLTSYKLVEVKLSGRLTKKGRQTLAAQINDE
jgi:hypothetical protein